jgi:hypothetical protein
MFLAHIIVHASIRHLCTGHVPMNLDNFNLSILICVSTHFFKAGQSCFSPSSQSIFHSYTSFCSTESDCSTDSHWDCRLHNITARYMLLFSLTGPTVSREGVGCSCDFDIDTVSLRISSVPNQKSKDQPSGHVHKTMGLLKSLFSTCFDAGRRIARRCAFQPHAIYMATQVNEVAHYQ